MVLSLDNWEEHLPSPAITSRSGDRRTKSVPATVCKRDRDPSRGGARRVHRPARGGGLVGHRSRLVRFAEGHSSARGHRRGLPAHPTPERRALSGPGSESPGPGAGSRLRRARDRRFHRRLRDVQPEEHQRRRRRVDRTVPPGGRWAREEGLRVRGYVSTAFGCPYEGDVAPEAVREVVHKLLDLPVDEISVGDTIGVATPGGIFDVVEALYESGVTRGVLALHLHDTRGTALANVYAGLECGITALTLRRGARGMPLRAGRLREPRDRGSALLVGWARDPNRRDALPSGRCLAISGREARPPATQPLSGGRLRPFGLSRTRP